MKLKIIAVPTEDKNAPITNGPLGYTYDLPGYSIMSDFPRHRMHLYMLAPDAEITPGDKVYSTVSKMIIPTEGSNINPRQMGYTKVIMSTDPSVCLPIIPRSICREFCEIENRKK